MPQSGVLGPILFLIHINDLSARSSFETALYADDTVLALSHKYVNYLHADLDHELPKIEFWPKSNQLSLNKSKTSYLFFTKSKKQL